MNKADKFVALRAFIGALEFTKGEFNEFVKTMTYKLSDVRENKFTLGIAYLYNDKVKIAHHLVEARKDYIWGIEIGDVIWSKTKVDATWLEATKAMDVYVSGPKVTSLPDTRVCRRLWENCERFSQTVDELRSFGIKADAVEPDDKYWVLNGDQAFVVGSDGKPVAVTDEIRQAKLRLCVFM